MSLMFKYQSTTLTSQPNANLTEVAFAAPGMLGYHTARPEHDPMYFQWECNFTAILVKQRPSQPVTEVSLIPVSVMLHWTANKRSTH